MGVNLSVQHSLSEQAHTARRYHGLIDRVVALALLVFFLPLLLVVMAITAAIHGSPVLYRGRRLGRGKVPFTMFKVRSLPLGTEAKVGGKLLANTQPNTTAWARFIRDTRLDELPQLFNVLKGDMALIGPRPVRSEVYHEHCKSIVDYDHRFLVKPGLVGVSQLFTPHSSPKRLRSRLDNHFSKYPPTWVGRIVMLACTGLAVGTTALKKCFEKVRGDDKQLFMHRARHPNAKVSIQSDASHSFEGKLIDIGAGAFRMQSDAPLSVNGETFQLSVRLRSFTGAKRIKTATCSGSLLESSESQNGSLKTYVIKYKPTTDFGEYIFHQYFLRRSLASYIHAFRK